MWRRLDEVVGQRMHEPAEGRASTLYYNTAEGPLAAQHADVLQVGILRVDRLHADTKTFTLFSTQEAYYNSCAGGVSA